MTRSRARSRPKVGRPARHPSLRRRTMPFLLVGLALAGATTASAARLATPLAGHVESPRVQAESPFREFLLPWGAPSIATEVVVPTTPRGGRDARVAGPDAAGIGVAAGLADNGIPLVALTAYRNAEKRMALERPGCGVTWSLLAAIGRVESNHGRFAGALLLRDGRSAPPVVGVALDGRANFALITDTDGGRYDGDITYDRAVGPMQFIPSSWAAVAADGDGNGRSDPFDIDDAALGAAIYLCAAGGNLRTEAGLRAAVFSYNHSAAYVQLVLDLKAEYERGVRVDHLPPANPPRGPLPPAPTPPLPPATIGPPPAVGPGLGGTAPTPSPSPTNPPTGSPTGSPSPSATPSPSGTPTPSPSETPSATPSPSPTASQSPSPACTPTPTPTPTTPTPTPESAAPASTPTPTPSGTSNAIEETDAVTPTPTSSPTPSTDCP
jgi:hypothetical protein